MPNAIWPLTLPQYVFVSGYKEGAGLKIKSFETDAGGPKTRAVARKPTFTIKLDLMNAAQKAIFDIFFATTIKGVGTFDWVHPVTQAAATFRILKDEDWSAVSGNLFSKSLTLEQVA